MFAVVLVELGDAEEVEIVTTVRRRVERTARGPGLARLEPTVVETTGEALADVIELPRRRAR